MRKRYSRRRRARKSFEGVELNFAAMLDMAFQLLAFFVLTFTPPDAEIQISMLMPASTVSVTKPSQETPNESGNSLPQDDSLPVDVTCFATPEGLLQRIVVGGNQITSGSEEEMLQALKGLMDNILDIGGISVISIKVHSDLRYELLIRVVDICTPKQSSQAGDVVKISMSHFKD